MTSHTRYPSIPAGATPPGQDPVPQLASLRGEDVISPDPPPVDPAPPLRGRAPPKQIKVLLPVWGYYDHGDGPKGGEYTRQFLRVSLPTLLAPGNLPALAKTLPTEFVFLTSRIDDTMIGRDPAYAALAAVCPVRFIAIDDIITEGNHSTTVTLAYARAVRLTGPELLDTCFFFLVADYIVADGSLAAVMDRMMRGASAVQTGNFQIVDDDAAEWLDEALDRGGDVLAVTPRQLMRRALTRLHPATVANMVNVPVSHNSHTNRLFWRVDGDTLIGRFYLMHMICVRPELTNFVIGASCDYSFVPEMCPSGAVEIMTDSDDYLVVEMQPFRHEASFIRLGPARPRRLAASLSEWTTAPQRANAHRTLIFRTGDIPPSCAAVIAEADAFVAEVARLMKPRPKPFRGHPYWRAAMAAYHAHIGRRPNENDWQLVLGRRMDLPARILRRAGRMLFGRPPILRRWHPRWADFQATVGELRKLTALQSGQLLVISGLPTALTNWLADMSPDTLRIPLGRMLSIGFETPEPPSGGFAACFIELNEADFDDANRIIDIVVPLLRPQATILITALNGRWSDGSKVFEELFVGDAQRFFQRNDIALEEARLVASSRLHAWANRTLLDLQQSLAQGPRVGSLFRLGVMLIPALFASLVATVANLASRQRSYNPDRNGQILSSVFMRLRAAPTTRPAEMRVPSAARSEDPRRVREPRRSAAVVPLPTTTLLQSDAEFDRVGRRAES